MPAGAARDRRRAEPQADDRAAPPALSRSVGPIEPRRGAVAARGDDRRRAAVSRAALSAGRHDPGRRRQFRLAAIVRSRRAIVRRLAAERRRRAKRRRTAGRPAITFRFESNQSHVGIAYPTIPYKHPDYFQAWAAVGVLSSGSSSRLFTEVRERRGLCYTVYASLHTQRDRASVLCYAGTTAERAQETLDVTVSELKRLGERHRAERAGSAQGADQELAHHAAGIDQRSQRRARARLVSLGPRANARRSRRDWSMQLSAESINAFLQANPPRDLLVVTLGPEPLEDAGDWSATSAGRAEIARWNFVVIAWRTAWKSSPRRTTMRIR